MIDGGRMMKAAHKAWIALALSLLMTPWAGADLGPQVVWDMDEDPSWQLDEGWAWGVPQGLAGDPSSGFTGSEVVGFNLAGAYPPSMDVRTAVLGPVDCTGISGMELRFMRWLGVEGSSYDHAAVELSTDGEGWITLWENGPNTINDHAWLPVSLGIADWADQEPALWIRWVLGPADHLTELAGWNLDDVALWGESSYATPTPGPGDIVRCYGWDMESDPGWQLDEGWAWGVPQGLAGDPEAGYSGLDVVGYNLSGAYPPDMEPSHAVVGPLDFSGMVGSELRFMRWLGVEGSPYDEAAIETSQDGASWTVLWDDDWAVNDDAWVLCTLDLGDMDGRSAVWLRWSLGPTDGYEQRCGWNLDDVEIWAVRGGAAPSTPTATPTATPSPGAPSPTPTACQGLGCQMILNQEEYQPGDRFWLQMAGWNCTAGDLVVRQIIILQVGGEAFHWPDWTPEYDYRIRTMGGGETFLETILDFPWPSNAGTKEDLTFWGALQVEGSSGYGWSWEGFSYRE